MTSTFTPDEIAALIEKLEAATGPDRELDDAIARFDGYCGSPLPGTGYTASIDAALTLVPDDHDWALHSYNGEAIAGCMPASEDGCDCSDSHGATPAIALCIASLRARLRS